MNFKKTILPDVVIVEPFVHEDERGYFVETYRKDKLNEFIGKEIKFCQDNESKSDFGVLRGLHYQIPPFAQSKLVRVLLGEVLDVVVDIRKSSPTFGKHISIILSSENKKQIYIPKGFAHGFIVLSDYAVFTYKVDNYYSAEHSFGIRYDDSFLNIDWKLDTSKIKLSKADKNLPEFNKAFLFD
jgi:dTDP-4-dehydrorhamnose 3,5-epimerase